ncbi:MAG: hypothetical protein K0Q95_1957 [Bacteroidota bacterium]|jgi:predicted extracellular nuclease|nr:hypothetical protein [Bacteroidota bacterium]
MKKLLLSVLSLASVLTASAQCNELFISEYVEGTGNDKAIEIYNPTANPINLSAYKLVRYSNGSSTASDQLQLSGTIAAHDVFVIVNGQTSGSSTSPAVSPALQQMADQLDGAYPAPTYMNGNDALTLEKNGTIVDIFGKIGEDPGVAWTDVFPYTSGSGTWITKDHTLRRKVSVNQGVTSNPTAFDVMSQWDSLPNATWAGLGTHSSVCFVGIDEIDNTVAISVFPNPSNGDYFTVSSTEVIVSVQVVNVVGQVVVSKELKNSDKNVKIETTELSKGLYIVKAGFGNQKQTTTKLIIK